MQTTRNKIGVAIVVTVLGGELALGVYLLGFEAFVEMFSYLLGFLFLVGVVMYGVFLATGPK